MPCSAETASFKVIGDIELRVQIGNAYIPVLSIPVDDCNRFALKPLRWLRFLGYTIYGNQGHISATADGPPVDYQAGVEEGALYYFTSAGTGIHSCWRWIRTHHLNRGASPAGHFMY